MKSDRLEKVELDEYGVHFETGEPVTFTYVRNTEKSPYLGERYQQHVEPTGIYLLHAYDTGHLPPKWVAGTMHLDNPLVIPFNTVPGEMYNGTSWKAHLNYVYKRRTRALTRALLAEGYDGIVTVELDDDGIPVATKEIVALRMPGGRR